MNSRNVQDQNILNCKWKSSLFLITRNMKEPRMKFVYFTFCRGKMDFQPFCVISVFSQPLGSGQPTLAVIAL